MSNLLYVNVCVYVHNVCAWYPRKSGEAVRLPSPKFTCLKKVIWAVMVHTFNPRGGRGRQITEASLVYS